MTIARTSEPTQLDPAASIVAEDVWTLDKFFEPLYAVDQTGKKLLPWLATGHEVSNGGKRYTFALRKGVKFSDGSPMTSADVKFSIDRNSNSDGPLAFLNSAIENISAPEAHTVVFDLSSPWAPFLSDISAFSNGIVPNNLQGKSEKQFFQNPVGTGPFTLKSWKKGSSLVLAPNTHYWQSGKPYLEEVTYTLVPDDNTRNLQLEGGQIDVDEYPPASTVKQLESNDNLQVQSFPAWSVDELFMNELIPQFKDRNVRRAIAMAINNKSIVEATTFGTATPAGSFFPPSLLYYDPTTPVLQYDVDAAKKELAKTDWPNGFDTEVIIPSGNQVWNQTAQIIQSQLSKIGIKMKINAMEVSAYKQAFGDFKYQMMINNAINDISDPDEMASFQCDNKNGGSNSFWTHYENPKVVKLVHEAQAELKGSVRRKLYSQIQAMVAQDAPYVPLTYVPFIWAFNKKVNDFAVNPAGRYQLQDVWLS